jgi:hypothetical protein
MKIAKQVDIYQNYRSGWEFYYIEKNFIEVTQFHLPTEAGYIPLPKDLTVKNEVVNLANNNDKCFQWAILIELHPVEKNAKKITQYKKYKSNKTSALNESI